MNRSHIHSTLFFLEFFFLNIEFPTIFPWHSHKIPIKLWWKPGVWGIEHQGTVGFPSPPPGSFDHRRRFAMLWCFFVPMFAEFLQKKGARWVILMTGDGESWRFNGLDKLRKTPQGSTWLGAMSSHVATPPEMLVVERWGKSIHRLPWDYHCEPHWEPIGSPSTLSGGTPGSLTPGAKILRVSLFDFGPSVSAWQETTTCFFRKDECKIHRKSHEMPWNP